MVLDDYLVTEDAREPLFGSTHRGDVVALRVSVMVCYCRPSNADSCQLRCV